MIWGTACFNVRDKMSNNQFIEIYYVIFWERFAFSCEKRESIVYTNWSVLDKLVKVRADVCWGLSSIYQRKCLFRINVNSQRRWESFVLLVLCVTEEINSIYYIFLLKLN